jgi:LuxR family transcriptional regulator, regulator of acetate metabolism
MPIELLSTATALGKPTRDSWGSASAALVRRYRRAFAAAGDLLPTHQLEEIDAERDRFLTEVGDRADQLHRQLLGAMRDRATGGDPRELAALCEVAIELQDIRSSHRQAVDEERLQMLTVGQQVSARLSPTAGVRPLLERAASAICDLPGLERAMVFQREGSVLRAAATVFVGNDKWARDCQALSASTRYELTPKRPEMLIVRSRAPAIVTDALNDPNAFQPIVQKMQAEN